MKYKRSLERLGTKLGSKVSFRRYSLPEIISESYKSFYDCKGGTNLQRLAEAHLEDVRNNPTDIDRLSRQLCTLKGAIKMVESKKMKDEELLLVPKEKYSKVVPDEEDLKESSHDEDVEEKDDENLLDESADLTEDELEELAKHLEELRKGNKNNKKMSECDTPKRSRIRRSTEMNESAPNMTWGDWQNEYGSPCKVKYYSSGQDITDKIIGVIYEPGGEWEDYGAEIYDDAKAEAIAGTGYDEDADGFATEEEAKEWVENWFSTNMSESKKEMKESGSPRKGIRCNTHKNESMKPKKEVVVEEDATDSDFYTPTKGEVDRIKNYIKKKYGNEVSEANYFKVISAITGHDDVYTDPIDFALEGDDITITESKSPKKMNEAADAKEFTVIVSRKGKDKEVSGTLDYLKDYFSYTLEKGYSYQNEKGNKKIDKNPKNIKSLIKNLNNAESNAAANGSPSSYYTFKESTSYENLNLSEFNKKSSSKAFVRTFKKMSDKLKEGTALTRQESISLYKAANSAMTHLSVELEHNPEFLSTFKESVTLLSKDVQSVLSALTEGKAPSKATMKSLAKFSEALLREAEEEEELPPIEDEEDGEIPPVDDDEFIGDDEGDIMSEEEEEYCQEYADAREEVHDELADKYEDTEDPGVQEKLAQDAAEVAELKGEDEEEEESEEGEGSPEESPEEEELEDDTDITDEELAELKKHLTEMRKAKKVK